MKKLLIITKHKTKIIWDKSLNLAEVTILRSDKKPIIKNRNKKSFNWKKEFSKNIKQKITKINPNDIGVFLFLAWLLCLENLISSNKKLFFKKK